METQEALRSPHRSADLHANFFGQLESYAVTGGATNELDRLCRKLWNCRDILSALACSDAGVPQVRPMVALHRQ